MSDLPQVPTYLTAQSPAQSFAQWGGVGQGIGNSIIALQAQAQAQAQARADAEKAAQLQALKDKAMSVNATNEDRHNLFAALNPNEYKAVRDAWDGFSAEEALAKQQEGAQAIGALENGNWQIVQDIYNQKADALENAGGDAQKIKEYRTYAQGAKEAPQALADQLKMGLLASPGGPAILDSLGKMKAGPHDIAKTDAETQKLLADIAKLKDPAIDPKDRFLMEEKLRNDYQTRSAKYVEAQRIQDTINTSVNAANGPGDYALVTQFLKMLDPTSVVRETEFAQAQNANGVIPGLLAKLTKFKDGELLAPVDREKYRKLAEQFMNAAKQKEMVDRKLIENNVKSYGLSMENIFPEDRGTIKPGKGVFGAMVRKDDGSEITFPTPEAAAKYAEKMGIK